MAFENPQSIGSKLNLSTDDDQPGNICSMFMKCTETSKMAAGDLVVFQKQAIRVHTTLARRLLKKLRQGNEWI